MRKERRKNKKIDSYVSRMSREKFISLLDLFWGIFYD